MHNMQHRIDNTDDSHALRARAPAAPARRRRRSKIDRRGDAVLALRSAGARPAEIHAWLAAQGVAAAPSTVRRWLARHDRQTAGAVPDCDPEAELAALRDRRRLGRARSHRPSRIDPYRYEIHVMRSRRPRPSARAIHQWLNGRGINVSYPAVTLWLRRNPRPVA